MSDTLFNECLHILTNIHKDMPDLRLGEVVQNALDSGCGKHNVCFSQVSTKECKMALQKYYDREKRKRGIE